jgi:ribulose-5-phosphate 4-epimerase/fuculose-1-phosphate aldolase
MGRNLICAAYMIRHAVHTARPDIMCVAHSHSIYGRAFSTLGRNLNIITQDTCAYYNDIVLYNSFKGVVLGADEGEAITKALASKKVAILQNHGLLTCAKTIESTVFWFKNLESCFHAQLLADAAAGGRGGETVKVADEDAAFTYNTTGTELAGWFQAKPMFDSMERGSKL